MAAPVALALFAEINAHVPEDTNTNLLMVFRWIHLIAGITWIGLLYFFNLVSVPLMKELDASTRGKVFPALMLRALWWFRMAAVITVLFGLAYWGNVVASDARNAGASAGGVFGSFFLIWTVVWGLMYGLLTPGKGILNRGPVIAIAYTIILLVACWAFLDWNNRGWESNRLLAIGLGGGIGWVMMLNVWGVIWRIQKRIIQWTRDNAVKGTPIPEESKAMSRVVFLTSRANAYLSIPLLFLMGAASHYPMFGNLK
jgi:uncharacterized membrane protein